MKNHPIFNRPLRKRAIKASMKIIVSLYTTYFLLVLSVFIFLLPLIKNQMMDQKKKMIHYLTENTWSLLSEYDQRVKSGELSLEDAQQRAVKRIKNLRYGPEGKDYFWVQDMESRVIMHPYISELEGKDQALFVDEKGKHVFAEFSRIVKEDGSGYVEYMWQWKDDQTRIVPKISYVKGFSPWGWVVGTGLYVDDVNLEIALITRNFITIFLFVLLIVILMSFYITWQAIKTEERKNIAEREKGLEELRLKKLLELSRMSDATLNELTKYALEQAINLTGSRSGYIAFLNDDETELTLHTWSVNGQPDTALNEGNRVFRVNEAGNWAEAVRRRDMIIINNCEDIIFQDIKIDPLGNTCTLRTMSIPVFDGQKIVALACVSDKEQDYDEADLRQMKLMMDGMWKIIQRKQSGDRLRESEERYRLLAENATDNIWILNISDLIFTYVSPSVEPMLGYRPEELIHQKLSSIMDEDSFEKVRSTILERLDILNNEEKEPRPFRTIEMELLKKDNKKLLTETTTCFLRNRNGNPDRILGISRDITERVELEKRFLQAQKMEALGTLAGGISHDFNNILSSVLGFTELAKLNSENNEETMEYLNQIMSAGLRAKDLVQHILTFSRMADVKKDIIRIKPLIQESLKFLRASVPAQIEIMHEFEDTKGLIMADPTQIHQVLMNLFTNAAHAMKEKGGRLDVRLKSSDISGEEDILQAKGLKPGKYIQLSVADTGCGIPKELIGRIFEPFFTTKAKGEGTGLGLSTVYGIIKDLDGAISVYSEPGQGSTFVIMIPEIQVESSKAELLVNAMPISGRGRILIVDDEEGIVTWMKKALQKLGYEVVSLTGSQDALDRFNETPGEFDLVVTDMSMPHMNGLELARQITSIRPDVPVILCTGFSVGLTDKIIKENGIIKILMKPVILGELAQAVHDAIKSKAF